MLHSQCCCVKSELICSIQHYCLSYAVCVKGTPGDGNRWQTANGVKADKEGLAKSRNIIEAQLRAYIGRNALDDESGFYYNIYAIDNVLQRAVKELKTGK